MGSSGTPTPINSASVSVRRTSAITKANEVKESFSRLAFRVMEMLKAMQPEEVEDVDFCLIRGLSAFDREVLDEILGAEPK